MVYVDSLCRQKANTGILPASPQDGQPEERSGIAYRQGLFASQDGGGLEATQGVKRRGGGDGGDEQVEQRPQGPRGRRGGVGRWC